MRSAFLRSVSAEIHADQTPAFASARNRRYLCQHRRHDTFDGAAPHGADQGRMLTQDSRWRRRLFVTMALTGMSIALFGMAQKLAHAPLFFYGVPRTSPEQFLPCIGITATPGAYLNLVWPICAALAFDAFARDEREHPEGPMAARHIPHPDRSGGEYFQGRSVGGRLAPGGGIGSGGAVVADRAAISVEEVARGRASDWSNLRSTGCARILQILGPMDHAFSKRSP